jgi:hypothetical protein
MFVSNVVTQWTLTDVTAVTLLKGELRGQMGSISYSRVPVMTADLTEAVAFSIKLRKFLGSLNDRQLLRKSAS